MKITNDALTVTAGAAVGAAAVVAANSRRQSLKRNLKALIAAVAVTIAERCGAKPLDSTNGMALAFVRERLADALDELHRLQSESSGQQGADAAAPAQIADRDATITAMQGEHERMVLSVVSLIKSLNAANARCAEYQTALRNAGVQTPEPPYFLAVTSDGSVAGPFSRS